MIRAPPRSPLFPYAPLSRSRRRGAIVLASLVLGGCGSADETKPSGAIVHFNELPIDGLVVRPLDGGPARTRRFRPPPFGFVDRSEEHTSEHQSRQYLLRRLL